MFNSSTLQHVISMRLYAESFIYSICLPEMLNFVSCVYTDQFAIIKHCVKIVCPQHTTMLRDMHASDAIGQWLRQWRVVKCCSAKCSNDV